jgi:lysophospholipase L1-like esterase
VILVALEIGLRIFSPAEYFAATVNTWDRELGTKQIPGARGFVVCPEYSIDLIINSKGLRDREFDYAKPKGTRRILCLGDSFTCGYGVHAEETFAKVLEHLLGKDENRTGDWEVLNAGVGSTGTAHHLAYFITEGYKYHPDFVLLCFCWANDFWDNVTSGLYSLEEDNLVRRDAPRTPSRKVQGFVNWIPGYNTLFARSHLLNMIKLRVARFHYRELAQRHVGTETDSMVVEREEILTARLMIALRDACRDAGCELVLTVVPPKQDARWDRETVALVEYASEQGITFVDLRPGFNEYAMRGIETRYLTDGHWNVTGHRLAAEILYASLADR